GHVNGGLPPCRPDFPALRGQCLTASDDRGADDRSTSLWRWDRAGMHTLSPWSPHSRTVPGPRPSPSSCSRPAVRSWAPRAWWAEGISTEGGRQAILRTAGPVAVPGNETGAADGAEDAQDPVTVLPAPYNARSRVHEYGGASWTVVPGTADEATRRPPLVVFVNFEDQRVHALREGEQPLPLTPVGPEVGSAHG